MKILECKVAGFGKLADKTFDFVDGCNVICRENGFGKSTLAKFIEVMFFGFSNDTARDEFKNERKRFKPWQGGAYGGSIKFSAGGREFLIERTFGEKKAEDKFSLRTGDTNLSDDTYSENIGEEIFEIDGESFLRTVCISQSDCETSTTDRINAKLVNLSENTDDMNNYETALKRIKDMINKMSPSRVTGSVNKLKKEISEYDADIMSEGGTDIKIETAKKALSELLEFSENEKKNLEDLKKYESEARKYADFEKKRGEYKRILKNQEERNDARLRASEYFKNGIPDDKELFCALENHREYSQKRTESDIYSLTEEEMSALKYGELFNGETLEISSENVRDIWEREKSLNEKREKYERIQKDAGSKKIFLPLILGAAFAAAAGVMLLINRIAAAAFAFAAVVSFFAALGFLKSIRAAKAEAKTLDGEIKTDVLNMNVAVKKVSDFFKKFGMEYSIADGERQLDKIRGQYDSYIKAEGKKEKYDAAKAEAENYSAEIREFLNRYGFDAEDFPKEIEDIKTHLAQYKNCCEECNRAAEERRRFETENREVTAEILTERNFRSLSEIGEERDGIEGKISEITEKCKMREREIETLLEEKDRIADVKEMRGIKVEEYDEMSLKYDRLEKTRDFLQNAKQSFTSRYTEPIMSAFKRYFDIIGKSGTDKFHIDADLNMTMDELGMQRKIKFLSSGTRSLIGLCMRLALVDAMYEGEKPPLILDDPFVFLDTEHLKSAEELLKNVTKDYQILYFTCKHFAG